MPGDNIKHGGRSSSPPSRWTSSFASPSVRAAAPSVPASSRRSSSRSLPGSRRAAAPSRSSARARPGPRSGTPRVEFARNDAGEDQGTLRLRSCARSPLHPATPTDARSVRRPHVQARRRRSTAASAAHGTRSAQGAQASGCTRCARRAARPGPTMKVESQDSRRPRRSAREEAVSGGKGYREDLGLDLHAWRPDHGPACCSCSSAAPSLHGILIQYETFQGTLGGVTIPVLRIELTWSLPDLARGLRRRRDRHPALGRGQAEGRRPPDRDRGASCSSLATSPPCEVADYVLDGGGDPACSCLLGFLAAA